MATTKTTLINQFDSFQKLFSSNFMKFLMTLGTGPDDTGSTKSRKFILVSMAGLMGTGALIWGLLLLGFGITQQAIIPFGYILVSFVNLALFHATKSLRIHGIIQVILSMVLPFSLQAWLGGLVASGLVCVWAPVAMLGALLMFKGKGMVYWTLLFIALTIIAITTEFQVREFTPEILTPQISMDLLGFNLICLVSLIVGLSVNNLKQDRKMRKQLYSTMEELKMSMELLDASQEEISAQSDQLEEKSALLEKKNHNINQSIQYAKRIQSAILPQPKDMCGVFQENMLLYIPRDQVGGDYYWCSDAGEKFVVVAADCTGHGVPGAFLSLLGTSMLESIVNEGGEYDPATILHKLDDRLAKILRQQTKAVEKGYVADGMDMTVCVFIPSENVIEFAGSMHSLLHVHKGELIEHKGSKFPVGDQTRYDNKVFETKRIDYERGDLVYLSSDGYKDQFGGPENRKYLSKNFKQKLMELHAQPLDAQRDALLEEFQEWKGEMAQTDDILVMGMRM